MVILKEKMNTKRSFLRTAAAYPHMVWSVLFIVAPLIFVLYYALTEEDASGNFYFSFANITALAGESYLPVFFRSICFAVVATAICLLLAYPLAYFLSKCKVSSQRMLIMLVMLPMWMNLLIRTYSWMNILETNGLINNLLALFGVDPYEYITDPDYFPTIYTLTTIWKDFGFGSILYFSTLSSIDPSLYEAARIDGANHMQQIWHITLPGLLPVISIKLIMSVGAILSSNTDMILLLYNTSTQKTADVIGTYVYRLGIQGGKFSYTTAVSLFMSLIGFGLTTIANKVSNSLTGSGLW